MISTRARSGEKGLFLPVSVSEGYQPTPAARGRGNMLPHFGRRRIKPFLYNKANYLRVYDFGLLVATFSQKKPSF